MGRSFAPARPVDGLPRRGRRGRVRGGGRVRLAWS